MKTIKLVFFALISFIITSSSFSQTVTEEWIVRYNGPGNGIDEARSLAVDDSGNVFVAGYSYESGPYGDYATIKYNSSGVQQWVARYNGPGNNYDVARSLAIDDSGNVYVTGYSDESGSGINYDYATIKYNSSGVQQWLARYNGPGNSMDKAYTLAVDGSGNVYVTGESSGSGTNFDYATIKYNSSGIQQWVARYNGPGNDYDYAYSLVVDDSGNVYITGGSIASGPYGDYTTIKYNSSGIQQWVARYNGPGDGWDYGISLVVDGSGNVYVTGYSYGSGTNFDYATIKYNSSGIQQWIERYNGPGNGIDAAYSLVVDGSGNVYVTGQSIGSGTSDDYATIKYNSSGVQQWDARYNGLGNGEDYASSLAVDSSGNVYVTGQSNASGLYGDYATIKYNSLGVQQWVAGYNGLGNGHDYAYSLEVDGSGNVYVTGYSLGNGTSYDFATIKYSQTTGIQNISSEIPDKFSLSQNYPNPFNPSTKIKFAVQMQGLVTIKVFDILGKEIKTLVSESLNPGTYETGFDASGLPGGVYFYKLSAGDFFETKKMILAK